MSNISLKDFRKGINNLNSREYAKTNRKESKLKSNRKNKKDKMNKIKQMPNICSSHRNT